MSIAYNTSIVRSGLALQLDAANPKSYPGSGTTWTDLRGNGNAATLYNNPTYSSGGLVFDGVNQYAIAPVTFSPSGMTLNLWLYLDSSIAWGVRFDVWSTNIASNVNGRFLLYRDTGTTLTVYNVLPSLALNTIQIANASTIFTGKWKNICVTSQTVSTTTTVTAYIDGVVYGSASTAEAATATHSSWYLMQNQNGSSPTKGRVSNASIYNRVLSAAEILQNFNAIRGRYGI